jgi:hypothetical protein
MNGPTISHTCDESIATIENKWLARGRNIWASSSVVIGLPWCDSLRHSEAAHDDEECARSSPIPRGQIVRIAVPLARVMLREGHDARA